MKVIINVAVVATLGLCLSSGSTAATAITTASERKAFKVVKEVASSRSTASADRKSRGESHRDDHLRVVPREGVRGSSVSGSGGHVGGVVDYDLSASEDLPSLLPRTPPAAAVTTVERFLGTNSPLEGETLCADEGECKAKSIELGYLFYTDPPTDLSSSTSTKGCFMKNKNVFYIPGTEEEMSATTLPGIQERVYCSSTNTNDSDGDGTAPTPVPTITTDDEGEEEEEEGGDIPTYSPTLTGGDSDSMSSMSLSMSLSMTSSLPPTSTTSTVTTIENSMEGTYSSTSSSSTMSTTATTTIPDPFDDGSLEITPIISGVEMDEAGGGGSDGGEDLSLNDIDDLSSLGALIGATGLLDELGKIGPFTLFGKTLYG